MILIFTMSMAAGVAGMMLLHNSLDIGRIDWRTCSNLKLAELGLFLLQKVYFTWFCWRSICRAQEEAADLIVFDFHIQKLWFCMPLPFIIVALHIMVCRTCNGAANYYSFVLPIIFAAESFLELFSTKVYLRWHQNHLKEQEGCCSRN